MSAAGTVAFSLCPEESRAVVRTRTVLRNRRDLASFLCAIAELVESDRFTGQIVMDVGQGRVATARLVDSMELKPLP